MTRKGRAPGNALFYRQASLPIGEYISLYVIIVLLLF
jgi:hypothetical protein